jgi:RNA polymerase sigma factor (sigma-70 family)
MDAFFPWARRQETPPCKRFATTRWSVVLAAGGEGSDEQRLALGQLIECYWYPLYAFARRQGHKNDDAMDLTQAFFTHLLDGSPFDSLSPEKGMFRSFLLAAFRNYMANQHRNAATQRRGGDVQTLSLTGEEFEARYDREPTDHETPELLFERNWVESLLQHVLKRLAGDYRRAGKEDLFQLLEPCLTHQPDGLPRAEISRQLKISPAAVAMSIHRMRRRFGEILRQEVAATVADPAVVEDELRALMAIVSRRS